MLIGGHQVNSPHCVTDLPRDLGKAKESAVKPKLGKKFAKKAPAGECFSCLTLYILHMSLCMRPCLYRHIKVDIIYEMYALILHTVVSNRAKVKSIQICVISATDNG